MPFIISLFSGLLGIVKGFFGFKQAQADVVKTGLEVLQQAESTDGQKTQAIASIVAAEANSNYWLAACWRPLLMIEFAFIIGMFWFGYVPPHFNDPMSPMMSRIFDILELGIGGYIPCRTLEKIVSQINIGSVLKTLIDKRIV